MVFKGLIQVSFHDVHFLAKPWCSDDLNLQRKQAAPVVWERLEKNVSRCLGKQFTCQRRGSMAGSIFGSGPMFGAICDGPIEGIDEADDIAYCDDMWVSG